MMRSDTDDYASVLLQNTPMIDLRAPIEYKKGSFPNSVNFPLMTDQEREQVGICYKRFGQAKAIELGHQLVSGETKTQCLEQWIDFVKRNPTGYLYCWRGGLRSKTVQEWLTAEGYYYPRIIGGYKAIRRFLIEQQSYIINHTPLIILAGRTGSAKTDLLANLSNSIDLEALAYHRGSSFGKHPTGQPTQLSFENNLAIELLRHNRTLPEQPIILEDEGPLIGRCALPLELCQKMISAPLVVIDAPLEQRLEHSFHNYILNKYAEWERTVGVERAFTAFSNDLQQSLYNIRKRLGGLRYQQLSQIMQQALVEHQRGNPEPHCEWIKTLLTDYYDPMYDYQLNQKAIRIIFRGKRDEVYEFLQAAIVSPKS